MGAEDFLQRTDLGAEASCRGCTLNFSIPRVMHQGFDKVEKKKGVHFKALLENAQSPPGGV